jgi:hypothetical protein
MRISDICNRIMKADDGNARPPSCRAASRQISTEGRTSVAHEAFFSYLIFHGSADFFARFQLHLATKAGGTFVAKSPAIHFSHGESV